MVAEAGRAQDASHPFPLGGRHLTRSDASCNIIGEIPCGQQDKE